MAQTKAVEPIETTRLDGRISFRVKGDEQVEVERIARQFGVSLSDAARIVFRAGLQRRPQLEYAV